MKTTLLNSVKWCVGVASLCLASLGHANLLVNGDFEAGVEAPWTFTPRAELDPSAGGRTALGAGVYQPTADLTGGSIEQLVNLQIGQKYLLEFYAKVDDGIGFFFNFGNRALADFLDAQDTPDAATGWTYYSIAFEDFAGGNMVFRFTGGNESTMAAIDDVSLTCENGSTNLDCSTATGGGNDVPEPGSLLLVGAALAGLGLVRRRKSV